MMTAKEQLRAMLDERGVKWTSERVSNGVLFTFAKDGHTYSVFVRDRAGLEIWSQYLTPEQAIEATLGREPDDGEVEKLHDRLNAALLNYARSQEHTKERVTAVIEAHAVLELAVALGCGRRVVGVDE